MFAWQLPKPKSEGLNGSELPFSTGEAIGNFPALGFKPRAFSCAIVQLTGDIRLGPVFGAMSNSSQSGLDRPYRVLVADDSVDILKGHGKTTFVVGRTVKPIHPGEGRGLATGCDGADVDNLSADGNTAITKRDKQSRLFIFRRVIDYAKGALIGLFFSITSHLLPIVYDALSREMAMGQSVFCLRLFKLIT